MSVGTGRDYHNVSSSNPYGLPNQPPSGDSSGGAGAASSAPPGTPEYTGDPSTTSHNYAGDFMQLRGELGPGQLASNQRSLGYFGPANDAYSMMLAGLGGQGSGETAFQRYGMGLLNSGQNSGQFFQNYGSGFGSPSASENWWSNNQQKFGQPTDMQNWWTQNQSQYQSNPYSANYQSLISGLQQPTSLGTDAAGFNNALSQGTALEGAYGKLFSGYGGSNYLNQAAPGIQQGMSQAIGNRSAQANALYGQAGGPSTTQSEYGNIRGLYSGANQGQQMYAYQAPQLAGPGMYEQFVAGALTGNDPYYQRLQQEQTADLDASMNARGGYNSGAALKAMGNQNAALRADQYHQLAGMAQGAQQATMQRLGQGMDAALAASGERRAQGVGIQGLSGQTEGERMGRLGAQEGISSALYGDQTGYEKMLQDLATQRGVEQRSITSGQQGLAESADKQRYDRLLSQIGLDKDVDTQRESLLKDQSDVYDRAAKDKLDYLNAGRDAAKDSSQSYLDMLNAGRTAAGDASSQALARLLGGMNAAGQVDDRTMQGLNDYLRTGFAADASARQRYDSLFGSALGLGTGQAGVNDRGTSSYNDLITEILSGQANLDVGGASAKYKQSQDTWQNILSLLGIGVGGARAISGDSAKAGAAAGGG